MFVFSLKQPLFARLRSELKGDADALAEEIWSATVLLDKLGLHDHGGRTRRAARR